MERKISVSIHLIHQRVKAPITEIKTYLRRSPFGRVGKRRGVPVANEVSDGVPSGKAIEKDHTECGLLREIKIYKAI